ncbi:MAG: hypothetical protein JNK38_15675 [Acidobacteria bacterium]|nr:hypothetical protein [Acidobacteriota bacterium]
MEIIFFLTPCLLLIWALLVWRDVARNAMDEGTPSRLTAFQFDGLFAEQQAEESRQLAIAEARLRDEDHRQQLLNLAAEGEESALDEAGNLADREFYAQVLQTLAAQANGNTERLRSIAEYIVDGQKLRSSSEFAETMLDLWNVPISQRSLADMLYLVALADDPAMFQRTVSKAIQLWRSDLRSKISAKDFLATVESAYWLISGEVRYSGQGFLLKQAIADVRRELATANRLLA